MVMIRPRVLRPNVPPGYEKRLKNIDRNLEFVWNEQRNRWEIWWTNPEGKRSRALIVGNGYNYQPLDERVFKTLRAGDSHKIGIKKIIEMLEEQDRQEEEAKEAELERLREAMVDDMLSMGRITQKPIGVPTAKEFKKPRGLIIT